jgi:hypothetical protein
MMNCVKRSGRYRVLLSLFLIKCRAMKAYSSGHITAYILNVSFFTTWLLFWAKQAPDFYWQGGWVSELISMLAETARSHSPAVS